MVVVWLLPIFTPIIDAIICGSRFFFNHALPPYNVLILESILISLLHKGRGIYSVLFWTDYFVSLPLRNYKKNINIKMGFKQNHRKLNFNITHKSLISGNFTYHSKNWRNHANHSHDQKLYKKLKINLQIKINIVERQYIQNIHKNYILTKITYSHIRPGDFRTFKQVHNSFNLQSYITLVDCYVVEKGFYIIWFIFI